MIKPQNSNLFSQRSVKQNKQKKEKNKLNLFSQRKKQQNV